MNQSEQRLRRIIAFAVFAITCAGVVVTAAPAMAAAEPRFASFPHGGLPGIELSGPLKLGSTSLDAVAVSLVTSQAAVVVDSPFSYTAQVRTTSPVSYLQVRMKLSAPDGRLIYQKTFIRQNVKPGTARFVFQRATRDLGLEAKGYPIELSVVTSRSGVTSETVIANQLLMYDPDDPPQRVTLVARVSALPLTDPQGRFALDPASYTRARDDVSALVDFAMSHSSTRLTLSLSPLMLREWRQLADGYTYESPEGPRKVAASNDVPLEYARVLQMLKLAVTTGRIELLSTGLSDPNVSALNSAGLVADVRAQYEAGLSAAFAAVETTASTGTAPAGGALPAAGAKRAQSAGIRYAILDERYVRVGKRRAGAGVYAARGSSVLALVADNSAARAVETSGPLAAVGDIYHTYAKGADRPVAVVLTVGPDRLSAETFIELARLMNSQPWVKPVLGRDAARAKSRGAANAKMVGSKLSTATPAGFWDAVSEARSLSRALNFALGQRADDSRLAETNALVAESSTWAGPLGDWAHAQRGLAFADNATRLANSVLSQVSVTVKPVTLAGTRGKVPITVHNSGENALRVVLVARGSQGARVTGQRQRTIKLEPQDNFAEIPVDLQGGLSGTLRVRLVAGGTTLSETTVALRASIADRLVIIAGIVVLLGGLLTYIIYRVRAAESGSASDDDSGRRYT